MMPTIKQAGRIVVEGQLEMRFWVRAFNLEGEINHVQELINQRPERKWRVVPVVSEYRIDDRFVFLFVLLVDVDQLGIKGGTGAIFYTSPEKEKEICKMRDDLADDILKRVPSDKWDEVVEVIEDKRESDRID